MMTDIQTTVPCTTQDKLLVIIGPSGSGKSTIAKVLNGSVVYLNQSYTTRPVRKNEVQNTHVFVSPKKFAVMESAGFFREVVRPFGLRYMYGYPSMVSSRGLVPALMLRYNFIGLLKMHYRNFVVYQIEAPLSRVEKTIKERGVEYGTRLDDYEIECVEGRKIADRVFMNDELNIAIDEIKRAIALDFQL